MALGAGLPAVKRRSLPRASVVIMVAAGLVLAGACGEGGAGSDDSPSIGVLLPGGGASRFGQFDRPLIEKKLKQLCPDCPTTVAATPDPAVQRQQLDAMITRGVDVLIIAAVAPSCCARRSRPRTGPASRSSPMTGSRKARSPVT